jgi:hypothetical protein
MRLVHRRVDDGDRHVAAERQTVRIGQPHGAWSILRDLRRALAVQVAHVELRRADARVALQGGECRVLGAPRANPEQRDTGVEQEDWPAAQHLQAVGLGQLGGDRLGPALIDQHQDLARHPLRGWGPQRGPHYAARQRPLGFHLLGRIVIGHRHDNDGRTRTRPLVRRVAIRIAARRSRPGITRALARRGGRRLAPAQRGFRLGWLRIAWRRAAGSTPAGAAGQL